MTKPVKLTVRDALLLVLDQVDYTQGACGVTTMVGAALPKNVIEIARQALAENASPSEQQLPNQAEHPGRSWRLGHLDEP